MQRIGRRACDREVAPSRIRLPRSVSGCVATLGIKTGPPTHSVGGQYCFALWRLSSSVTLHGGLAVDFTRAGQAMTSCRLQSNYSSTVTLHGGPVVLRPVRATPCSHRCAPVIKQYAYIIWYRSKRRWLSVADDDLCSCEMKMCSLKWHFVKSFAMLKWTLHV